MGSRLSQRGGAQTGMGGVRPERSVTKPTERQPEGPDPQDDIPQGRVLTNVYIPRYITVHLGAPSNASGSRERGTTEPASSEIYPTWPENAIRANIYAQISFALNRIFTEWYPSRAPHREGGAGVGAFDVPHLPGLDQLHIAVEVPQDAQGIPGRQ